MEAERPENRMFESVVVERDGWLDDVRGRIPDELVGTLYRNGPACWDHAGGFRAEHAFDGDGLITRLSFEGGRVHHRNRFVRTTKFAAQERGRLQRGLGTMRPGGAWANAFRPPADRANTHAVFHAGSLWALTDDGRPWEIDADDLSTHGRRSLGGVLPPWSLFSPHPRIDPITGELFNFGLAPDLRGPRSPASLRCYRIDAEGRTRAFHHAPLSHLHVNHDFAITSRYLVFVLAPITIDFARASRAVLGLATYESATVFRPSLGTRVLLVPRDGGPVRIADHEALAYVHLDNAYDDGDDVVVHLIRLPDWESAATQLRDFRRIDAENSPGGSLIRLRVRPSGRVDEETVCDAASEFPRHDERRTGRPYRFSYVAGASEQPGELAVIKVDHANGDRRAHRFARGGIPGEPLFVPRAPDAAEDDGYLLCLAYHAAEHRSALHVIDARHPEAPALAVAWLPDPRFPGFHGSFTRRVARSGV